MSIAVAAGALVGVGCVGIFIGLRVRPLPLEAIAVAMDRTVEPGSASGGASERTAAHERIGALAIDHLEGLLSGSRGWNALAPCLAITGLSSEQMVSKMLVLGGAGLLVPPLLWAATLVVGLSMPATIPVLVAAVAVPTGVVLPIASVVREAQERQRHVRVVLGSFVDLVVLGLAGGVGVEGALLAAAEVSPDWAARRMARALAKSRDSGVSPWVALGRLGEEIGVPELVELSNTLQLAGTEGARIRQSLSARAGSLRRHEQAEAESAANAMTERLFLPGALLLVGFLLFVGYPAFSRILGGF
ncbi:MAG: type II secretion system F family protein [Acidimicrobiales bacterium]